jgi:hypothetical protein
LPFKYNLQRYSEVQYTWPVKVDRAELAAVGLCRVNQVDP